MDIGSAFSGNLAAWATVVISGITGVIAMYAFVFVRTKERRQALTDLHVELTSGEIARARHTIGTLLYADDVDEREAKGGSIEAYFVLIWALQRARNVFRTQKMHWKTLDKSQSRLLEEMHGKSKDTSIILTWNLTEIARNVETIRKAYGECWSIEDSDAWADISVYIGGEPVRASKGLRTRARTWWHR